MSDGDLKATISYQDIANIYNITYQATPWLESTFRYTIFNPSNPIRNSSIPDGLNDRSYSVKIKLVNERQYIPQLAIGIKDLLGTGAWSSEYLVASKKFDNLDLSLGIGWGRLSEEGTIKNPLTYFSDNFSNRYEGNPFSAGGKYGGKLRTNSFFKGNQVGLFGGLKYNLANTNFSLLAEYNTDSYTREIVKGTIANSSPLSFGIEWRASENFNFALTYQQGNELAFLFSSEINTKKQLSRQKIQPFYSSIDGYELSGAKESLDLNSWYHRLFHDLKKIGVLVRNAEVVTEENKIILEISNQNFNYTADALERVFSIVQIHTPSIDKYEVIINEDKYKIANVQYSRDSTSDYFQNNQNEKIEIKNLKTIDEPKIYTRFKVPYINFDINLATRFQLFDPQNPIKHQVYLNTGITVNLPKEWKIRGAYATDLHNDFDMKYVAKSENLPNVRTDINSYLVQGESGIDYLFLEKKFRYKDIFYRFYFGALETMYSGAGLEMLYQPYMKSRFAVGSTINSVRKRGYKRNLDLLDYRTTTGFLSLYYASPFYNFDFALHLGRYLAKDKGLTIEARRTFDNGFSIGAFATFTDVSAADFGEGSFDKGLYFKIPFNAFGINTKSSYSTIIRSIQRDGGQRVENFSGTLWHQLRNVRYDSLSNNQDRMLPR